MMLKTGPQSGQHASAITEGKRLRRQSDDTAPFIPTPKLIAEGCRRIRAGWSADDRRLINRQPLVETLVVNAPHDAPSSGVVWF